MNNKTIKRNFYVFGLYQIGWVIVFFIIEPVENLLFSKVNLTYFSILFIPHGIRVLSALSYGYKILPGLFLAHILAGSYFINDINLIIALSTVSVASVFLSIEFFKMISKFNDINLKLILVITILSSILNSLGQITFRSENFHSFNLKNFFGYAVGDTLGTLFLFYLIKISNKNKKLVKFLNKL